MYKFLYVRARQLLTLTAFLLLAASGASAHTGLKSSEPMAGSTWQALPENIVLQFAAPVRLVGMALTDENGDRAALSVTPAPKAEARYEIPLPPLTCGEWTMRWIAMGSDGHKMSGDISFSYVCGSVAE
jgi:copper resistance protein C